MSVQFTNNTEYSKFLTTWVDYAYGINKYEEVEVGPGKEVAIRSTTGEWEIYDYFYDDNISKYHNCGYRRREYIGKFRLEPCVQGNRAWLETDKYEVVFDGSFVLKNR